MSGKELLKKLKQEGWTLDRVKGSHHILIKGGSTVVVPVHGNTDMPKGTLNGILKQSGLK
jgi:predicted RNA binding protein YcfA (HicA-like mRNA interferase family)